MESGWRKTRDAEFITRWSQPFADFNTSSDSFYTAVETAFAKHEAPEATVSRVVWKERSALSPQRTYLRFERDKYICDVCAAPFGKDFFFSSWLVMRRPSLTFLHWTGMATTIFVLAYVFSNLFGPFSGPVFLVMTLGFLWWLVRSGTLETTVEVEEVLLGLTVIGAIWELRRKPTYFEIDAAMMFQSAIQTSLLEVIDELTESKGLPRLRDDERKPILREFFRR